jgi:hypothetical protein
MSLASPQLVLPENDQGMRLLSLMDLQIHDADTLGSVGATLPPLMLIERSFSTNHAISSFSHLDLRFCVSLLSVVELVFFALAVCSLSTWHGATGILQLWVDGQKTLWDSVMELLMRL